MRNLFAWAAAAAAVATVGLCSTPAEAQWGTLKGQVTVTGDFAPLKLLVMKDDKAAKDAAVCAAADVPNESVVIDPATKGLANVVVWIGEKPSKIHPDLLKPAKPEIDFDQKGCRFLPHILLVRTDQKVRVMSDDSVAHNTHTWPRANKQVNFIVGANDRAGVVVKEVSTKEKTPTKITCDIHSWMEAYWVILDHPYAAVSNAKGEFEIANLPVGVHEIKVWQETSGWLIKSKMITIKEGNNALDPIKVDPAAFK